MTDKKTDAAPAAKTPPEAVLTAKPKSGPPQQPEPKKTGSALVPALVLAGVLVIALGGAVWYQQQAFQQSDTEILNRLQRTSASTEQALKQGKEALQLAQQQTAQITQLQQELRLSKTQISGLEQAFQLLTDSGSDLVLINDIDHLVTIAQQQLQLGGNVSNAIISLETAQAQLARANRPALASLQQTINGDLEHLRAASTIDIALLSRQLEELAGLVSHAALMVPDDAHPQTVESAAAAQAQEQAKEQSAAVIDPDAPWWQQTLSHASAWSRSAWDTVGGELEQLVSIRRVDDTTALLLSPDQAARLRENLRLRIMTAQLALMMRQPGVWQTEIASVVKALETRFDPKSAPTRKALAIAYQMADTDIDAKLPTVNNSLQALEALRELGAKEAQQLPVQDSDDVINNEPDPVPITDDGDNDTDATQAQPAAPDTNLSPALDQPTKEQG